MFDPEKVERWFHDHADSVLVQMEPPTRKDEQWILASDYDKLLELYREAAVRSELLVR